jgi:hypothetical protein
LKKLKYQSSKQPELGSSENLSVEVWKNITFGKFKVSDNLNLKVQKTSTWKFKTA